MSPQVAGRRQRNRDRGQQHRDQRRKPQEFFRAVERLPHFGPQIADALHAQSRFQLRCQGLAILLQRGTAAAIGHEQAPRRAISGLQQVRRGYVVDVEQQLGAEREHHAGDFRLVLQDRPDGERGFADFYANRRP